MVLVHGGPVVGRVGDLGLKQPRLLQKKKKAEAERNQKEIRKCTQIDQHKNAFAWHVYAHKNEPIKDDM